jgi:hypothetical protein
MQQSHASNRLISSLEWLTVWVVMFQAQEERPLSKTKLQGALRRLRAPCLNAPHFFSSIFPSVELMCLVVPGAVGVAARDAEEPEQPSAALGG